MVCAIKSKNGTVFRRFVVSIPDLISNIQQLSHSFWGAEHDDPIFLPTMAAGAAGVSVLTLAVTCGAAYLRGGAAHGAAAAPPFVILHYTRGGEPRRRM